MLDSAIQIGTFVVSLESVILSVTLILFSIIVLLLIKSKSSDNSLTSSSNLFRTRQDSFLGRPRTLNLEKIRNQLFQFIPNEDFNSEKPENADYELKVHEFNVKIKDQYATRKSLDPFQVIEEMKVSQIQPDVTTFNTLIDICFAHQNQEAAFKLFEYLKSLSSQNLLASNQIISSETKAKTPSPDVITYNTIIKGLSRQLNDKRHSHETKLIQSRIFKIFKEIPAQGIKANEITYNSILDACVKAQDLDLAFEYFDKMKSEGLHPDNFTYATLVKGIKNQHSNNFKDFRLGHEQSAENSPEKPFTSVFDLSPEKGSSLSQERGPRKQTYDLDKVFEILTSVKQDYYFKPDEILFNCVIDACIKFKNLHKALEVFNEMTNLGLKPSGITYSVLIKGFGNVRQFDNVMKMYKKMQSDNAKINEVTYGCLIDACIKCNRLNQAMEFFLIMKQDPDIKVNSVIYSILIKGFTTNRNFDKAFEVFTHMQNNTDFQLNIITYNAMLECAIKCNKPYRFFEIYDIIISKVGGKFQPDLITYSTYIKGLCKFGQVEKALSIYTHVRNEKLFRMDEVLFNSLLHGLQKAHEFEKAIEVYHDMEECGVKPSHITYSILIKIYSDQMKIDQAIELFEEVKKISHPSLILYTCIIQCCVKCKKMSRVTELYQEMRKNGIKGIYR